MRSGQHWPWARQWLGLAACLIGFSVPAAASEGLRVLLVRPEDPELVTRVEGQTRDLGVRLEVTTDVAASRSLTDPEQAALLARARSARFVVQIERVARGGLEVRVYDARRGSLRRRSVPAREPAERFASSAELEAAALVLRGELSELIQADVEPETPAATGARARGASGAAGGSAAAGTRRTSEPEAQAPSEAAPKPEPAEPEADEADDSEEPAEPEPPEEPGEALAARRGLWSLQVALRGSIPIQGHVIPGLALTLRAPLGWLELGVHGSSALPVSLARDGVEIELWRHALGAHALAALPLTRRLRLLLGVGGGVVLYARTTAQVGLALAKTPSRISWNASLGAHAELQWLLGRHVGLALALGLDAVLPGERFAYEPVADPARDAREIAQLAPIEPWATAGFLWLFH
jgi:hypothetical protein